MTDVTVRLSVQVPGGPTIQSTRVVAVDAYEQIDVALPPKDSKDATVAIDVLGVKGKVKLLLVQNSLAGKDGGAITWSLGDAVKDRNLTEPQLFLGSDAIDALGLDGAKKITFKNTYPATEGEGETKKDLTKDNAASLSILIGRVA
jgi:hypothetical protein